MNFHVNAQPITTTQITNWLRRLEIRSAAFAASSDLMAGIAVEMGKDLPCDVQAMNVIQIAPRECHRAMGECHQCYLEGISLNVGLYRDRRISAVVPSYQISRSRKFLKRKYFVVTALPVIFIIEHDIDREGLEDHLVQT